jgi:shikimate kinase
MSPVAVLVGLPGSGKTTTGRALAARLGVGFVDTDVLIEQATGRSVTEIFAADGEPAFRAAETQAVTAALTEVDGVLALGGGAVISPDTRRVLVDSGVPVVLLRTSLSALAQRVGDGRGRPLLAGSPTSRLADLASARDPLYRTVAGLAVDTDGRTPDQVAAAIADLLATVRAR